MGIPRLLPMELEGLPLSTAHRALCCRTQRFSRANSIANGIWRSGQRMDGAGPLATGALKRTNCILRDDYKICIGTRKSPGF